MMNKFRENFMIKRNRKGVIGFLLTMAVGVALGAAALVVSSEMQKDNKADLLQTAKAPSSPAAVEKAFEEYQKAYKAYQQAVGLGRKDIQKYADEYRAAKKRLELEIFRNTPGVSDMDMDKFQEKKSAAPASSQSTSVVESGSANPFGESEIVITGQESQAASTSQPSGAEVTSVDSKTDTVNADQRAAASAPAENSEKDDETEAKNQTSAPATAANDESRISGMDYYRVKSGDSLSKICQKYYGNSGMWTHILKYQIPSIAATPNLIFPGQLIALPRGLTADRNEDSFISPDNSTTSASSDGAGDSPTAGHQVAAPGDESWQTRFQKDYLISDHGLTNVNTMSVADIQRFLDSKNSCLAKPYNGSTPAQMIYNAARKYGINPQVLLARLQCEQGLISKTTATKKQLDWALGVGCYDSGNWNQNYKGLDKQIEFAAATYRRHYDNARQRIENGERITMTIDGQSVRVKNAASYAFYKYCPHFQGNKLFYDVWNGYKRSF
jgi:LysM repeat protein